MRYNILIILSLLFINKVEAQNNMGEKGGAFRLEITIPAQANNTLYLGEYRVGGTYAIDSVKIGEDGKAVFTYPDRKIDQGQYFLHIKPSFLVDFLIGNEQDDIRMSIKKNPSQNTVSGSEDTKLLWQHLAYIAEEDMRKNVLQGKFLSASEQEKQKLQDELSSFDDKLALHTQSFIGKHSTQWAGIFLKGMEYITLPYPPPKDNKEFFANKEYGKAHYFDNINLTDPRFWRTNYFTSYIDSYMQQWIDPVPDSLAAAASRLVAKTINNDICFKEMLSKLTNEALTSGRMGDENIWARLYEDYIMDKNITWIDSAQISQLKQKYSDIEYNRIGMKARNLTMETPDGKPIATNGIAAEYTLLYFYNPDCGYCQLETPKFHDEVYKKYKEKGLEVIAINTGNNKQEWLDFVKKNKLTDWINCADLNYKSQYWLYYDTSGIPATFILDKDKTIIAKKINEKNVIKFLDHHIQSKNGTN